MINCPSDPINTIVSTFGTIYLFKTDKGQSIIVKKYNEHADRDKRTEAIMMKSLNDCAFIADVYDSFYCNRMQGLIMPYYQYQIKQIKVNVEQIQKCLYQLLSFASYLEQNGVIHRDLKPENILVDNNGMLKVIDFGLACYRQETMSHQVCTIWYRAPEILWGQPYDCRSDLWSIGCLIAQLILGDPLFKENTENKMIDKIFFIF